MSVKLVICGRRRPGQSLGAHRHHMKDIHGKLVLDYIAKDPESAPRHYVQNQIIDGWFATGKATENPLAVQRDFVTEISFPDMKSVKASRETEYYLKHLQPDEARMVDEQTVFGMPMRETGQSGPSPEGKSVKLFILLQNPVGTEFDSFSKFWSDQVASTGLASDVPHVRWTPLVPAPIAGIDVFWFENPDAAQVFAYVYQSKVIATLESDGLLKPRSSMGLIGHEYILFSGAEAPQA